MTTSKPFASKPSAISDESRSAISDRGTDPAGAGPRGGAMSRVPGFGVPTARFVFRWAIALLVANVGIVATGGVVRVEDMRISYWAARYDGARRVLPGTQSRQSQTN